MTTIGNYRVISKLAEGGCGVIYVAEHVHLNEKACLKRNLERTPYDYQLLLKEAKLMWNLDECHSIPAVKDFMDLGDNLGVIVMKYIEGDTIERLVEKSSSVGIEEAAWITERTLEALLYSHYNGVVHTDVKPQNVIAELKKHDIKLIDWGNAVYLPNSKTRPVGLTEAYAAPELFLGSPPIPETDIYGAGIVLLYMLGGDVQKKSLPDSVPKDLADFCNDLIRYDPRERPNWDRGNPLVRLSDIREKLFSRRHTR